MISSRKVNRAVVVVAVLGLVGAAAQAVDVNFAIEGTGTWGTWAYTFGIHGMGPGGSYHYYPAVSPTPGDGLRYTPGVAGEYDLFVSYAVNTVHATAAPYIVDPDGAGGVSATTVFVDMTKDRFDNVIANGYWSGWKYIGTFDMTVAGTVFLDAYGNGNIIGEVMRVLPASLYVDATIEGTGLWGSWTYTDGSPHEPRPAEVGGSYNYHPWANPAAGDGLRYTRGVPGTYDLFVSYAVNTAHATAAPYIVDPDGAGGVSATTVSVDMTKDSLDNVIANGYWSGWKSLGTFDMTVAGTVFLDAYGNGNIVGEPMMWVPKLPPQGTVIVFQ